MYQLNHGCLNILYIIYNNMTYLIEGVTLIDPEEMSIIRHSFAVVKTTNEIQDDKDAPK